MDIVIIHVLFVIIIVCYLPAMFDRCAYIFIYYNIHYKQYIYILLVM